MDLATPARSMLLPPIGTHMPHLGGTFWALMRGKPASGGISQHDYALIVPHGEQFETTCAWGGYGKNAAECDCTWDGFNNTAWLLADGGHPAAEFCACIEHAGFKDFYLPSLRELKALFASGCDAYSTDGWYWASTQYSRSSAFFQSFDGGSTGFSYKSWEGGRARAARRSSIESLNP